jgi:hypothetical protein
MHLLTMLVSCVLWSSVLQWLLDIGILSMSPINMMSDFSIITNSLYIPDLIWMACLLELLSEAAAMAVLMFLKLPLSSATTTVSTCVVSMSLFLSSIALGFAELIDELCRVIFIGYKGIFQRKIACRATWNRTRWE